MLGVQRRRVSEAAECQVGRGVAGRVRAGGGRGRSFRLADFLLAVVRWFSLTCSF
jgi:hypothetical protein